MTQPSDSIPGRSESVFVTPEKLRIYAPQDCFLWARLPLKSGPVNIWLPKNVTVDELTELVVPYILDVLQMQATWTERLEAWKLEKEQTNDRQHPGEDRVALA